MSAPVTTRLKASRPPGGIRWLKKRRRSPILTENFPQVLNEGEIRALIPTVRNRLRNNIEERGSVKVGKYLVPSHYAVKNPRSIISNGTGQAVMSIGNMDVQGKIMPMVAKISRVRQIAPEGDKILLSAAPNIAVGSEMMATYLKDRGFPVVMSHAIPLDDHGARSVVISPDLRSGGHVVSEAHGFDFDSLVNGRILKKELGDYVKRLEEMDEEELIYPNSHIVEDDPSHVYRKCFHVRWDPRTREGELLMGDLDHISPGDVPDNIFEVLSRVRRRSKNPINPIDF